MPIKQQFGQRRELTSQLSVRIYERNREKQVTVSTTYTEVRGTTVEVDQLRALGGTVVDMLIEADCRINQGGAPTAAVFVDGVKKSEDFDVNQVAETATHIAYRFPVTDTSKPIAISLRGATTSGTATAAFTNFWITARILEGER